MHRMPAAAPPAAAGAASAPLHPPRRIRPATPAPPHPPCYTCDCVGGRGGLGRFQRQDIDTDTGRPGSASGGSTPTRRPGSRRPVGPSAVPRTARHRARRRRPSSRPSTTARGPARPATSAAATDRHRRTRHPMGLRSAGAPPRSADSSASRTYIRAASNSSTTGDPPTTRRNHGCQPSQAGIGSSASRVRVASSEPTPSSTDCVTRPANGPARPEVGRQDRPVRPGRGQSPGPIEDCAADRIGGMFRASLWVPPRNARTPPRIRPANGAIG